jgi:very-short-patch-repair endonuclease
MPDHLGLVERASAQHHLVTVQDARRLGISGHRWRTMRDEGWWVAVSPSHYRHASTPLSLELRIRAGLGWLGRDAFMFGSTALWWLGADVTEPARPEFLVPRRQRSPITGMTVHTSTLMQPADMTRHRGLRTSTAARAVIDMASGNASASEIERAIDSAVSLRRTSLPTLRRRLGDLDGKGRHGCALLRELLLDSGGESHLERRFLRLVRSDGLPRPKCQVTFRGATGRPLRVDFLFGRLVVEVSGRLGHSTDRDRQRTGRRRIELEDQGYRVIEFTTADVIDDPRYVLRTIRKALNVTK